MGGTGNENIKITQADVMSNLQKAFMDQYIRGIQQSMGGGFNFGQAYPGPSESGYTNMPFNLLGGFSGYSSGPWDDPNVGPGGDTPGGKSGRKRGGGGHSGRGGGGENSDEDPNQTIPFSKGSNPLTTFLQSLPMMNPFGMNNSFPQFSGNTPAPTSAAEEALTSPFANAMTQNLTGNFPKAGA